MLKREPDSKASKTPFVLSFCLLLCLALLGQVLTRAQQTRALKLSAGENALVQSSRAAIIGAGISAPYFEEHFKLERAVDTPSDRRVVWKYSIGEYQALLNDAVGFYTDETGRRVNLHSISDTLSKAHDIKSTIPRKRAERLMQQCIGNYRPGAVVYQPFGNMLRPSLLFTASSVPPERIKSREEKREEARREREREKRERAGRGKPVVDKVDEEEEEDEDAPTVYTGFIDLETGTCTKGVAQVEYPRPVK